LAKVLFLFADNSMFQMSLFFDWDIIAFRGLSFIRKLPTSLKIWTASAYATLLLAASCVGAIFIAVGATGCTACGAFFVDTTTISRSLRCRYRTNR
jgi:hypothetical protein